MSGFSNAVVGGIGTLVRTFIKSVNFVTGVSGWIINRDGSAEFNNLAIRGTETLGSLAGPHIILDGNLAKIDIFETATQLAIRIQASQGIIQALGSSGAQVLMVAAANGPGLIDPGLLFIDSTGVSTIIVWQDLPSVGVFKLHVSQATWLQVDDGGLIVNGPIQDLSSHRFLPSNVICFNGVGPGQNFTTASKVAVTGLSTSFTKFDASTRVLVQVTGGGFSGIGSGYKILYGVTVQGGTGDLQIGEFFFNSVAVHQGWGANNIFTSAWAAGTFTVNIWIQGVVGNTMTTDSSDSWSLTLTEII